MERQARECAEEQLAVVTARQVVAEEAAVSNRREADAARDRGEVLVRQLEQQAAAHSSEVAGFKARLSEVGAGSRETVLWRQVYLPRGWAAGGLARYSHSTVQLQRPRQNLPPLK